MKTVGLTFEDKAKKKAGSSKPKQAKKPAAPETEAGKAENGADKAGKDDGAASAETEAGKADGEEN